VDLKRSRRPVGARSFERAEGAQRQGWRCEARSRAGRRRHDVADCRPNPLIHPAHPDPLFASVVLHQTIQEAIQLLVHLLIAIAEQLLGRLDEGPGGKSGEIGLRGGDQALNDLAGEFHVALETVDESAIFDDLPRATLAGGEYRGTIREARHVVMPVSDLQSCAETRKLAVRPPLWSQRNREFSDLGLGAMLEPRAESFADKLRSQADADYSLARLDTAADQLAFRRRIEVRAFGLRRPGRLRPAHDHQQIDVLEPPRQRLVGVETGAPHLEAATIGPGIIGARGFEGLMDDKMNYHRRSFLLHGATLTDRCMQLFRNNTKLTRELINLCRDFVI
jgi:hypothetical protein